LYPLDGASEATTEKNIAQKIHTYTSPLRILKIRGELGSLSRTKIIDPGGRCIGKYHSPI